ncbi:MAG: hypothetical protein R8L53_05685 [Mariprofundales bacterium]
MSNYNLTSLTTPLTTASTTLPIADAEQMYIPVNNIFCYEHNPRQQRNSEYDAIKESIKSRKGLSVAINVTQRPNESFYIVESGGNTRLQCLRELYEETGDAAFAEIMVIYRPWISELNVIHGHLIENMMRGNLTFYDQAKAIITLKSMIDAEQDEPISGKAFVLNMTKQGIAISRTNYMRMQFHINTLAKMFPNSIHAIILSHSDDLQNIYAMYKKYWAFFYPEHDLCADRCEDIISRINYCDFPDLPLQKRATGFHLALSGTIAAAFDGRLQAANVSMQAQDMTLTGGHPTSEQIAYYRDNIPYPEELEEIPEVIEENSDILPKEYAEPVFEGVGDSPTPPIKDAKETIIGVSDSDTPIIDNKEAADMSMIPALLAELAPNAIISSSTTFPYFITTPPEPLLSQLEVGGQISVDDIFNITTDQFSTFCDLLVEVKEKSDAATSH